MRAGLSRPRYLDYFQITDPEEQETSALLGHPIRAYTEGFFLMARWLRLAEGCLRDLFQAAELTNIHDPEFWRQTGLIAVLPPSPSDRFGDEEAKPHALESAFLPSLHAVAKLKLPTSSLSAITLGHAGTALAIRQADREIDTGKFQRVIVVAVDSYLDPVTLAWLNANNRLKSDMNPAGLSPGEAAAACLLESDRSHRIRSVKPVAFVTGATSGREAHHLGQEDVNFGMGLSKVWGDALLQGTAPSPFNGDVVSDLNGEPWRSYEFGCAQVRISGALGPDANFVFPAVSIGETGAASGMVGVCMAVQSFQRKYASSTHTLVISSSEFGHVGSMCLASANNG